MVHGAGKAPCVQRVQRGDDANLEPGGATPCEQAADPSHILRRIDHRLAFLASAPANAAYSRIGRSVRDMLGIHPVRFESCRNWHNAAQPRSCAKTFIVRPALVRSFAAVN